MLTRWLRRLPQEWEIPCLNSACGRIIWGSSRTSGLKIGTPVAILSFTWQYRVSAETGWPSVGVLWLGEMESWICNSYLGVEAHKIVWADPSLRYTSCCWDVKLPTNSKHLPHPNDHCLSSDIRNHWRPLAVWYQFLIHVGNAWIYIIVMFVWSASWLCCMVKLTFGRYAQTFPPKIVRTYRGYRYQSLLLFHITFSDLDLGWGVTRSPQCKLYWLHFLACFSVDRAEIWFDVEAIKG